MAKLADLEFGYQDESDDSSSNVQPHRVQGQSRTDQGQSSEPPAIPDTVRPAGSMLSRNNGPAHLSQLP